MDTNEIKCDRCGNELHVHDMRMRTVTCHCGNVVNLPEKVGWGWVVLSGLIPIVGVIIALFKFIDGQRKTALACLVTALSVALVGAAILLPALARARSAAQRALCQNNLKQMGLIFKMYADESKGELYPMLDPNSPQPMFLSSELWPEYMTDLSVMFCLADPVAAQPSDLDALFERKEGGKMTDDEWM